MEINSRAPKASSTDERIELSVFVARSAKEDGKFVGCCANEISPSFFFIISVVL